MLKENGLNENNVMEVDNTEVEAQIEQLREIITNSSGVIKEAVKQNLENKVYRANLKHLTDSLGVTNANELAMVALTLLVSMSNGAVELAEMKEELERLKKSRGHRIQPGQQIALKKNIGPEEIEQMKTMRKNNVTIKAIAEYYGCSIMTVRRKLGLTDNGLKKKETKTQ